MQGLYHAFLDGLRAKIHWNFASRVKVPMTAAGSCVDGAHGSRDLFGFLLAVGCKSCVRPVCAVPMTAGPDVIRRSGPYHSLALDSA